MKLIPHILAYLTKSYKAYSTNIPALKPSSLGSCCYRRIYYEYFRTSPDTPPDAQMLLTLKVGSVLHTLIQSLLSEMGASVLYLDPNTNISNYEFLVNDKLLEIKRGSIDGVLILDNQLYLLEIKTCNERKFASLEAPLAEHLIQGGIYFYLFNKHLFQGDYKHITKLQPFDAVKSVIFLYINKNTMEMKEFEVEFTDEQLSAILDKVLKILEYIDSKTLPDKTDKKFECKYCLFKDKCAKNFNPAIQRS